MIKDGKFLGLDCVYLSFDGYEAVIVPEAGGNLVKLYNKEYCIDILRYPQCNADEFIQNSVVYGIPVLFFPNRIAGGTFTKLGYTYRLPQNEGDNHLHGFLYNKKWQVTNHIETNSKAAVELTFRYDENTDFFCYFPHKFEFKLTYEISGGRLWQKTQIINGETLMPFGLGYHTAFNLDKGDYRLTMGVSRKWEVDKMIPSGKFLPLGKIDRELATCGIDPSKEVLGEMLYTMGSLDGFRGVIISRLDLGTGIDICYEWGGGFDFGVLWNDEPGKGFVCAEPQTWAVNAPNIPLDDSITGFKILEPNEQWQNKCSIYIKIN